MSFSIRRRSGWIFPAVVAVVAMGPVGCMDLSTHGPAEEFPIEDVVFAPSLGIDLDDFEERQIGIWVREDSPGMPPNASPGSVVEVAYTLWLPSGEELQRTGPDDPFSFELGSGEVILGFAEGVNEMGVGQIRTVLIPPSLGYGLNPPQGIPQNSWLIFELVLVSVDEEGSEPT